MSETTTEAPAETTTEAEETPAEPQDAPQEDADKGSDAEDWRKDFDPDKAAERIRKLQSEAKNLRERVKAAEPKAASADEKDKRISTLERDLLRERVGRRLSLPDELVDRLRGETEDELLADAEKLVGLIGKPSTARKPAEQLRSGLSPEKEPEEDPREVARRIKSRGF